MPPVLSMGGGRSAWLSVHCEPVSEWEPSARTSCQEKEKNYNISAQVPLSWHVLGGRCFATHSVSIYETRREEVLSVHLHKFLPTLHKIILHSTSERKHYQLGCTKLLWAPQKAVNSPHKDQCWKYNVYFLPTSQLLQGRLWNNESQRWTCHTRHFLYSTSLAVNSGQKDHLHPACLFGSSIKD